MPAVHQAVCQAEWVEWIINKIEILQSQVESRTVILKIPRCYYSGDFFLYQAFVLLLSILASHSCTAKLLAALQMHHSPWHKPKVGFISPKSIFITHK